MPFAERVVDKARVAIAKGILHKLIRLAPIKPQIEGKVLAVTWYKPVAVFLTFNFSDISHHRIPMLYRNFQTQAELDAQYNPAQAPGIDILKYMIMYNMNSARVREELPCNLNIPFGPYPSGATRHFSLSPTESTNSGIYPRWLLDDV